MQVPFGDFVLDLDSRELRRGSECVRLSPKAFQLLELLVTNRPKALSKADLQDRLWPDTFVVEKNLANLVGEIRQALGQSAADSGFIRTVPRFGYAFHEMAATERATETRPVGLDVGRRRVALAVGAGVLVAAAASVGRSWVVALHDEPARIRLAVLPFQNLTGDPAQDYLCDGLTEEMIAQLGGLQPSRLSVIARTSALQYKNTSKRAKDIARELGVQFLLETSVRRTGDRVRIAAQLIEAKSQTHVWAEQDDHDLHDLLVLQREVAAAITRRISDSFGLAPPLNASSGRHTINPVAYEHYLRGRWHWAKDTAEGLQKGKEHFLQAIALDPTYALAHSGLADTYALLGSYDIMPIGASHPLGRDAALKALKLNDGLSEAHNSMAAILADYYWDWPEADRHFKRAIALAEDNVTALRFYSFYLAYTGRATEALPLARRAISLDPLSLGAQVNLGVVLNMARRYDEAVAQFVQTLELDSSSGMAHAMLGLSYAYKGMADRAVSELEQARKTSGDRRDLIALHGYALARAGRTREALATIEELHRLANPREPSPFLIAVVAVGLEDRDRALESLERAFEARDWALPMMKADPFFDTLRSEARFVAVLDRLGLPH